MIGKDKTKEQRTGEMVQLNQQVVGLKTAQTKRKRGQRLPLESEVRFNTFADLATDCIFLFDSELNCVEISKAALWLFPRGTKKKDVVGKHLLDISLGLKETGRYNKCLEVLKTGIPFFEDIIIPGTKFAGVRLAASVFRVNNGLGIAIKFATDIEKLEYVEKELSEAEERYRSLVENTNDVVYILDDKAVVTYVSPAIESILGYSASEIIGQPVYEYIYQEDWQLVMERFRTGSFPNIPGPFELRVLTKSGEVRWVRNSPRTLIKQNRLIGYQGVLNDITDSKRALEDLKRNEQQFRALIENAQDAIVIVNPDATIRYESPSMARMTGRKAKDRIDKNPLEFCHPDDTTTVAEAFIQLLENKIPIVHTELRLQHKNGRWLTFEVIGTNLIDDPAVGGIVLNLREVTERKQAEEAMRESEDRYRTLVETMNDGLAIQDRDGVFTFVNNRLCEMLGLSRDELIGVHVMELLDEVSQNKYKEEIRRRRQGERVPYEIEFTRKDGSKVITRVSPQLITDQEGNPVGSFGVVTDITERKRVEEAMHESQDKLRAMFESIGDAVIVSDLEGRIIEENKAALRMQGYSHKKEVIGRSGLELVAEKDRARVIEAISNALKLGYGPLGEFMFIDKNGRELCGEASAALLRDSSGNPEGFISVIRDITERKLAEEELTRLSNAVRMSTDSIVIGDLEVKIVEVNEATLKMYGTDDKGDLLGKSVYDLIAPEDREKAIAGVKEVLETGHNENHEYHIITKDGSTILVAMNTAVMKGVDGKPIGFVSVSRDITERKRVEEALQESEERFRSLVENAPYMIIIADSEGKILLINYTTSGFSVEDTIGTSIYDYISVEYHDKVSRSINGIFKSGEPAAYEITGAGPDGTTSWYSVRLGPIKHDGHIIAVTLMTLDITERKRAEEELRESEEKIRNIFEAVVDAIVFSDLEGHIIDENEAALRIQGYSRVEEVIGKSGFEFIAEEDRARAIQAAMKAAEEGYGYIPDVKFVSKDGIERDTEATASLVRDASGNPIGFVSSTRDITERKKAEKEIRESEELLRAFMESATDVYTIWNSKLELLNVSEKGTKAFLPNTTREDMIGKHITEIVPDVKKTGRYSDYLNVMKTGRPLQVEGIIVHPKFAIRNVSIKAFKVRDGLGLVLADITERKKAEKELRESEKRYRDLVDKEKDIIYTLDAHGNITSANPAVSMLGYTPEQVIGKNFIELIPNEWQEKTVTDFNDLLNTGEITAETVLLDKKGTPHLVEYSSTVISEGDRVIGTRGIVRDITERKKAEEELRHYSERLRAMAMQLSDAQEHERRRLAQELHDRVGQSLTALSINLSMVSTQLPEAAVAPVLSILDDSQSIVEQTAEIIRDVMANLQPPVLEDYGLVAALRWYADRFASRTGISVTVRGKDPSPRLNTSSENTLFRIVQETLTNVAKHAQATQVSVIVAVKKRAVRLVVTDDGVGFNVADVINSDVQQGWGLTTMSERVKSLGGSFDIESRPGHGTRVVVEIGR